MAGELRAVLIAGPTASGKSALATDLAERVGGIVVNADSMQVYRDLRVVTARPEPRDEARAPHRLYGHVDAGDAYSTGRWLDDVAKVLAEASGRVAVLVGGTGLYFKALIEGISPVPPVPDRIREAWRARAAEEGAEALHRLLSARDPAMGARLRPSDPQRVVRALEVLDATGRSLAEWQKERSAPLVPPQAPRIVLDVERPGLSAQIEARARMMMEGGAVEEVRRLLERKLPPSLPCMRALGVKEIDAYIRGETDFEEAVAALASGTRRYAKRQSTWFRTQLAGWQLVAPGKALDSLIKADGFST